MYIASLSIHHVRHTTTETTKQQTSNDPKKKADRERTEQTDNGCVRQQKCVTDKTAKIVIMCQLTDSIDDSATHFNARSVSIHSISQSIYKNNCIFCWRHKNALLYSRLATIARSRSADNENVGIGSAHTRTYTLDSIDVFVRRAIQCRQFTSWNMHL